MDDESRFPFLLEASLSCPTAPVKNKYRQFFRCRVGFVIPSLRPSELYSGYKYP